jgi:tetratricopeptide (TPR) repeat protein
LIYLGQKNDEERLLLLNRLASLNPNNSDAFYRLGSYYSNKDYNNFKENFDKALLINPNNWDVNRTVFF